MISRSIIEHTNIPLENHQGINLEECFKNKDVKNILENDYFLNKLIFTNMDNIFSEYDSFLRFKSKKHMSDEPFKDIIKKFVLPEVVYSDDENLLIRLKIVNKEEYIEFLDTTLKMNFIKNIEHKNNIVEKYIPPEFLIYLNKNFIKQFNLFALIYLINIKNIKNNRVVIGKNKLFRKNNMLSKYVNVFFVDNEDEKISERTIEEFTETVNELMNREEIVKLRKIGNFELFKIIKDYNIEYPIFLRSKRFKKCNPKETLLKILNTDFMKTHPKNTYNISNYVFKKIIRDYNEYKPLFEKYLWARQALLTIACASNNFSVLNDNKYKWIIKSTPKFHMKVFLVPQNVKFYTKNIKKISTPLAIYDYRTIGRTFVDTEQFLRFLDGKKCVLPKFKDFEEFVKNVFTNKRISYIITKHPETIITLGYYIFGKYGNNFDDITDEDRKILKDYMTHLQEYVTPLISSIFNKLKNRNIVLSSKLSTLNKLTVRKSPVYIHSAFAGLYSGLKNTQTKLMNVNVSNKNRRRHLNRNNNNNSYKKMTVGDFLAFVGWLVSNGFVENARRINNINQILAQSMIVNF